MRFATFALSLLWLSPARAGDLPTRVDAARFALVVGSNAPGPGQAQLKFAESDAARLAGVLTTLGGHSSENVQLLRGPQPAQLLAAIEDMRSRVQQASAAGRDTQFLFYYSGHARSTSLNLGKQELALDVLRATLLQIPASVRIVVLDACQSGAFSRVRGARAAPDFSYNSAAELRAQGTVVVASSSGAELSQESDEWQAGFFTHHWLMGLRGAADKDRDGQVTLSEAYDFAYRETLASTARTQVGSQHVTLETEIKGKGELVLSYPAAATARVRLGQAVAGAVVLFHMPSKSVFGEVSKAAGEDVSLALPPGAYQVLIKSNGQTRQCDIVVAAGSQRDITPELCREVVLAQPRAKGDSELGDNLGTRRWALELAIGLHPHSSSQYTSTLESFEFAPNALFELKPSLRLSFQYKLAPLVSASLDLAGRDHATYVRDSNAEWTEFSWDSFALTAYSRVQTPQWWRFRGYAKAGVGAVRASTRYKEYSRNFQGDVDWDSEERSDEVQWGYELAAAAGISFRMTRWTALTMQLDWVYAPALENLLGQKHDLGGVFASTGLQLGWQ